MFCRILGFLGSQVQVLGVSLKYLHDTTSTMLETGYGVLGVKSLTFFPLNILLLIVATQPNICFT